MEQRASTRIWIIASIVLFLALIGYIAWFPPAHKAGAGGAVAKVNGVAISKEQLYDALVKANGKETLQNMIDREVIRQEADKAGVTVSDAEVNDELASVKKSFPSDAAFQQALASYGMTVDMLKENLTTQVYLRKLLGSKITVTDDEIQSYYKQNLDSLKTPEEVRASHIVTETKAEAEAVLKDLKGGADFAKTAQAKSIDPETKDQGGDLGFFAKGDMDPAIENAAFSLQVGETSGVVQTQSGYEIIKVTGRHAAATPTLEQEKDQIRKDLIDQKVSDQSQTWLQQKESQAKIENNLSTASP